MTASLFPDLAPPPSPSISRVEYLHNCQAVILRGVLAGCEVDADHVHRLRPCPDGIHPSTLSDAFAVLAASGLIVEAGFKRSSRPCRHAGVHRR